MAISGTLARRIERIGVGMKFSEKYGIVRQSDDDWYDTFLPADTKLFVDPFLIWEEKDGFWAGAHSHLIEFFDMAFDLIRQSNGDPESIYWKKAASLLIFREPAEFCLGVAEGTPFGSGSGAGLQKDMLDGVRTAVGLGMYKIAHMETISLFQGGMGFDRISDSACNILKSFFINYTQDVCRRHNVETERIRLENASWSSEFFRWESRVVELPTNTITYLRRGQARQKKIATLLTPERFLRELPVAEPNGFWAWSWANHGGELRNDFNFDVARNVARNVKARLARQHPDIVALYLQHLEGVEKKPYPIGEDPKALVKWYAQGAKLIPKGEDAVLPASSDQFNDFVRSLVEVYRQSIEHTDSWLLLWNGAVPHAERVAQVLFRSMVIHYCRANGVEMSSEANAGRGPVDFKFSGWSGRALIEMKLVKSSKIWDGILAQLPEYQNAEGVNFGLYVAIAFTDDDYSDGVRNKLNEAARLASEYYKMNIEAVLIDGRRKDSASKLKNRELSDQLHRGSEEEESEDR